MSKYQKLDSGHTTNDDDEEESFSLYFDDNHASSNSNNNNTNQNNNNNSSNHINNNSNINNGGIFFDSGVPIHNHNNHSNNVNNNNNNIRHNAFLDLDEQTMEVPLLSNNNNDYEHTLHHRHHQHHRDSSAVASDAHCRCAQLGFSVNLKNKSAQEAKFKILFAISICCIFMIIEFLGGYIAGSLAIMTDAAHLASDCISFIIGLVAIWLGSRPPDAKMSFGYKRMEVVGAIVSILGIWILTATLVLVAIQRIYSNDFDLDAKTMMIISGIGILINIAMIFILHGSWLQGDEAHGHGHGHGHSHAHGHSHLQSHVHRPPTPLTDVTTTTTAATATTTTTIAATEAITILPNGNANGNGLKRTQNGGAQQKQPSQQQHEKNLNLRAAMIHVIGDLVQSIGVFLASILIKFYPSAKFADPLCTLLFSVIVIMTTVNLFKESVGILLDAVPAGVPIEQLEQDILLIDGVKSVHHLNVWSHTANHNVMMVHLVIDLLTDSNTVLDKTTRLASNHKYNIKHSTIQIERLTS